MSGVDRRKFLKYVTSAAATSAFADSIAKAASIEAHSRSGSINDVEHVVVPMPENRAFDHYFGTMRGIRGFSDPHPVAARSRVREPVVAEAELRVPSPSPASCDKRPATSRMAATA